ncbi:membrane protein insertase YidC [Candidatus Kaiserbacteria bacterium]|nr:membrane protein insertase YidC [Candidatus Kaiserbacteria bacterium]
MISTLFHAIIYNPIYNGLVFFVDLLPTHDIGIAVVIVTVIVRLILFPLSRRAIKAQMGMKALAPEIEALKKKYKDNPQEHSRALFALYRERDVHPFAGFLVLVVQIPILLGLYWVFARAGFPTVHADLLYSFVPMPHAVNMEFLGLVNMGGKSIVLAMLAALTQLIYTRLSMGPRGSQTPVEAVESSFSADMAKSFDLQARYVLPIVVGVIAYTVAAAAPLYWVTSNIFMIAQEYLSGRRFNGIKKDA